MDELSIKNVLKVSLETYKEEWKTLLLISFISIFVSLSGEIMSVIIRFFKLGAMIPLVILTGFLIKGISFYLMSRLTVTLILASKKALSNEEVLVPDTFNDAKSLTWRYIGYSLILGLIITLSCFPIVFTMFLGKLFNFIFPIKIFLYFLGILLPVYVGTIYYFSLVSAVVYPDESDIFSFSKKLVKDNFLKVFLLLAISLITIFSNIAFIPLFASIERNMFTELGINLISSIPNALFRPFAILICLEAMKVLEGKGVLKKYFVS